MQTFLPYSDFERSAAVLDRQRLGKQRVECKQLLHALGGLKKGWANHPAAKMWRGHEWALVDYSLAVCREWTARGYVDNQAPIIEALRPAEDTGPPRWLGDPAFHLAHRANLRRKLPDHYGPHLGPEWDVDPSTPYVWPV